MAVHRGYFQTEVGCAPLCIWHCDTTAEMPTSGMSEGDFIVDIQATKLYWATSATTKTELTNQAGAANLNVQEEGTTVGTRPTLNFIGSGVTAVDNPGESRVDVTISAGGSASATTVEKDLGSTPKWSGKFTITDAAIGATSKVLCWQAPGPYTGKGTRADEAEMQPVQIIAVEPASGSAVVKWQTPPMIAFRMEPKMGQEAATSIPKDPQAIAYGVAKRLGKVRGNVKFSYSVFA